MVRMLEINIGKALLVVLTLTLSLNAAEIVCFYKVIDDKLVYECETISNTPLSTSEYSIYLKEEKKRENRCNLFTDVDYFLNPDY